MLLSTCRGQRQHCQRGATLFLMVVCLVILLGVSALAIDLGLHYVVRSEAQRAADAGALAGAKEIVESGYFSGFATQAEAEDRARQVAITVAAENLVGGQAANVLPADVSLDFSNPDNPLITVLVGRDTGHGNPMPTLFARALGITESDISAVATAEAFTPSGASDIPVGTSCLKPWIMPNCDPTHTGTSVDNICNGQAQYVDFDSSITGTKGAVISPGLAPTGVVGYEFTLKPGLPSDAPAPGQFYPIQIPPGTEPALCPECASTPGGSEGPGAALYRHNIACCNTNQFVCDQLIEIDEETGNMVGPTSQGVRCLIHQATPNCQTGDCGQDYILDPSTDPFYWVGGSNNPVLALRDLQGISSTDSLITVPLYKGYQLTPGESGALPLVQVIGFLQVFVKQVEPGQAKVTAYVMNVTGCGGGSTGGGSEGGTGGGGGSSGSGGVITTPAGSPYPVRLVRPSS